MKRSKFDYDRKAYKNGLDLSISVQFYDGGYVKMDMLSCTVSDGRRSTDYEMVAGETTIEDVIREFLGQ